MVRSGDEKLITVAREGETEHQGFFSFAFSRLLAVQTFILPIIQLNRLLHKMGSKPLNIKISN